MSGAEETVKTGFYHESVQAESLDRDSCVRDAGGDTDSDRDSEFWELRDLWHIACLECIVSV